MRKPFINKLNLFYFFVCSFLLTGLFYLHSKQDAQNDKREIASNRAATLACGASSKQLAARVGARLSWIPGTHSGTISLLIKPNGDFAGISTHDQFGDDDTCVSEFAKPIILSYDSYDWLISFTPTGRMDAARGGSGLIAFRSNNLVQPMRVQIARDATNQFRLYFCRNGGACNEVVQNIFVKIHTNFVNLLKQTYRGTITSVQVNGV